MNATSKVSIQEPTFRHSCQVYSSGMISSCYATSQLHSLKSMFILMNKILLHLFVSPSKQNRIKPQNYYNYSNGKLYFWVSFCYVPITFCRYIIKLLQTICLHAQRQSESASQLIVAYTDRFW